MATLSLVVRGYRRADGTYQVAVSLSHKSCTCYIATGVYVSSPSHLVGSLLRCEENHVEKSRRLRELLEQYKEALLQLGCVKQYTCAQLRDIMTSYTMSKQVTLTQVADERCAQCKPTTATVVRGAIKRWLMYTCDMQVAHITPTTIQKFSAFLQNNTHYSNDTVSITLRTIKSLINYAVKNQYVSYQVHPFINTPIPRGVVRELPLTLDDIQTIRQYKPAGKQETIAKDFFFLTFYLGGINVSDILELRYFSGRRFVKYVRKKTSGTTHSVNEVTLPLISEANIILDKYSDEQGARLDYSYTSANLAHYISMCVRKLMRKIFPNKRIVLYSARKAFAQFALDLGFSDNVINYCLGHSNNSRGIIAYYNKIRVEQAGRCLQAVADYISSKPRSSL